MDIMPEVGAAKIPIYYVHVLGSETCCNK